ncbi:unnamed protein product [Closterium sp. Yama58-4]|nr:unnamed protein product [Closterium sp. Yama58-4]
MAPGAATGKLGCMAAGNGTGCFGLSKRMGTEEMKPDCDELGGEKGSNGDGHWESCCSWEGERGCGSENGKEKSDKSEKRQENGRADAGCGLPDGERNESGNEKIDKSEKGDKSEHEKIENGKSEKSENEKSENEKSEKEGQHEAAVPMEEDSAPQPAAKGATNGSGGKEEAYKGDGAEAMQVEEVGDDAGGYGGMEVATPLDQLPLIQVQMERADLVASTYTRLLHASAPTTTTTTTTAAAAAHGSSGVNTHSASDASGNAIGSARPGAAAAAGLPASTPSASAAAVGGAGVAGGKVAANGNVPCGSQGLASESEEAELDNFMGQFVKLLRAFKEQLEEHIRVHAREAVTTCARIKHAVAAAGGAAVDKLAASGATMSDDGAGGRGSKAEEDGCNSHGYGYTSKGHGHACGYNVHGNGLSSSLGHGWNGAINPFTPSAAAGGRSGGGGGMGGHRSMGTHDSMGAHGSMGGHGNVGMGMGAGMGMDMTGSMGMSMGMGVGGPQDRSAVEEALLKEYGREGFRARLLGVREEIMRKRRAGKLPGNTTQVLKAWWNEHIQWPYPTEEEKAGLMAQTGLELKQVNNWFINQRKRNWHGNPAVAAAQHKGPKQAKRR